MTALRIFSIFTIAMAALIAGCTAEPITSVSNSSSFSSRTAPATFEIPEISRIRTVSLSAVGDILIHGTVYNDARTKSGYDFNPIFAPVKPLLEEADLAIANSESVIGGSAIGLSTYPAFNSPFEVGDALKHAGIDVVTLANNHTLDRGEGAIRNAISHWRSLGISTAGSYLSQKERDQGTAITKNGITFSFLSYTYGTNGQDAPTGKEYLVQRIDKEAIRNDLAKARAESDIVVLSLHFGVEYENMPNAEQVDLAHFSAEHGADIILGHHPHVLQPAQWIDTRDGRKVFAVYSLGNFLSGQDVLERKIGGIIHITAVKMEKSGSETVLLRNPAFTPTFVRNTDLEDFKIELLKNIDPKLNAAAKRHMAMWIPELEFKE